MRNQGNIPIEERYTSKYIHTYLLSRLRTSTHRVSTTATRTGRWGRRKTASTIQQSTPDRSGKWRIGCASDRAITAPALLGVEGIEPNHRRGRGCVPKRGGTSQCVLCVVFTFNRSFYSASAHPVSVLTLHPREIQILWSQS